MPEQRSFAGAVFDSEGKPIRFIPHPVQVRYFWHKARFCTLPAGRRSGKTALAKRRLFRKALADPKVMHDPRFFFGAPTRDHAKRIYWNDVKLLARPYMIGTPSEGELVVRIRDRNGYKVDIHVVGLDRPERVEGVGWDGCVVDEFGDVRERAWPENIRPALSDRAGWADLIGVPAGRNHYFELDQKARALYAELGKASEWRAYHWTAEDVMPLYGRAAELEQAKRDLDPLTYDQEFKASFVTFTGRAYYGFDSRLHAAHRLPYNPRAPLAFCFDFNVAPGVATVIQETELPGTGVIGTAIIGEVHIPQNSNTPAVCDKLIADWGGHEGPIYAYGDYTGGARGSAKTEGSDWDIILRKMWGHFGSERFFLRIKPNPRERDRLNAVNSRILSTENVMRLMVDPHTAPNTVKDFEGVRLLEGGSGEIDKKHDTKLSHLSDSVGYYVEHQFPVRESFSTAVSEEFAW